MNSECPRCGKKMFVEYEDERGVRFRCIHCMLDVVRWKND